MTFRKLKHRQSFVPDPGPGAIERLLTEVQPPLVGMAFEWPLTVDAVARTAESE